MNGRFIHPMQIGKSLIAKNRRSRQIARERNALCRLSDDYLKDIGLTRVQANFEMNRSLFDLPSSRCSREKKDVIGWLPHNI